VVADADAAAVAQLADVLNTDRLSVLAVPTDVRDEAQLLALVERTPGHFGGLDVLVDNAGCSAATTARSAISRPRCGTTSWRSTSAARCC
jgi:NAD(P)-dependent dehydrogenase (short-subunit alcohol dehydrogenase family)